MPIAYLSIGSNLGDRYGFLKKAIAALQDAGIEIVRCSSVYETIPVGYIEQPNFLNAVLEVQTNYSPHQLLDIIHAVERDLGRQRNIRWGPRTIDIDILLYDEIYVSDEDLVIPHPEMLKRAFVLVPLGEIRPDIVLNKKPVAYYIDLLKEQGIKKLKNLPLL
ncbi:2-amino-4-hydroxy-6-hydroxymethyldihydropteridinediphosphokinase [Caldanaerobius fijiensis DSM 17918]|uniref:2-amino-4-hydroxy-6-hydroxymethyldihydropteridine diphosphokinase n=1 Tax=Caldanaerobius fijiensis DSM 17918 TaxID=1121256 RepID=A0A1M4Z379_9THEO|nr:2-amino-4-hydroxy-6-hydroxymethyldihydropteridine diphosphokinase [Caldanaerobius fijiensis]SHF12415.1 2-amino-4-hydroxy-6-hydroxymethyldihydropteridinediphosphokinase [Caldanaerobius fijiensis DSM 17918]